MTVGALPTQPPPVEPPAPANRSWSHYKLEDGSWDPSYLSDAGKLPERLAGCSIEITPRRGDSGTATVTKVIERRGDFILVRDSGKG